ncbi:MAG: twin-arginine translocase subunit TatC [Bacteriovoracaceae bacterium]|nr:twin-arginine translocase subunit TatC [Bacteriovoracaceae bacterium]
MAIKQDFKEMTLVEHLDDLRACLIRVVIALCLGFFAAYYFSEQITYFLLAPLVAVVGKQNIIYLSIFDKVTVQFHLAFVAGAILSSPLWFWQVWLFIRPALHDEEKKMVRPILMLGFFLFCAGVCFTYYILLPFGINMFTSFGLADIKANIDMKDFILMTIKVMFFMGLMFQIPMAMLIIGFMGIVTKQSLHAMRRYVYVGATIVAAVFTPPDVISQLMMLIPLIVLFELGVMLVALIVHPYLERKHMGPAQNKDVAKEKEV